MIENLADGVREAVDRDGYALLEEHGYITDRADRFERRLKKLKKELERRGERLVRKSAVDKRKNILIWFELYRGKTLLGKSRGVKLVARSEDEKNG